MKAPILLIGTCFLLLTGLAGCGRGEGPEKATTAGKTAAGGEAPAEAQGQSTAEKAASTITAEYMRGVVKELSDDKYQGRGPGSHGG
ncbi:MAG TPA: hypothetical protein VE175_10735, partial [Woeseiaceae bacterium]|nr:hypothetical protein [Woeseiaceae bacterium]